MAVLFLLFVALGQNCSKVDFVKSDDVLSKLGKDAGPESIPGPDVVDGGAAEIPDKSPSEEQSWLLTNCDSQKLKASPTNFNYSSIGTAVKDQQKRQSEYTVEGAQSVELQQLDLINLKITKSGDVNIHQINASKIEVEAKSISQFQQLSANEIFLKTALIGSANLQQLGSPYLHVEANLVDGNIQQLSALCLATHLAKTIQQVDFAHVIGRPAGSVKASIERVQQGKQITIEDAEVGHIQQVDEVTLRNVRVGSIQQVGRLTLINSTVGRLNSVGQVIKK